MNENNMVIKMGDITKNGAGQLYVDRRLIPSENLIDFISNMNNSRMMTIPFRWQYDQNLSQFFNYLLALDHDFDDTSTTSADVMNYPYFKYLISRYNKYVSQYGRDLISLKHTFRKDPYYILKRTQKIEWTTFLQTLFNWYIGKFEINTQRQPTVTLQLDFENQDNEIHRRRF